MLIAGAAATVEHDLKKIIALSTLRQLGVIMAALGLGEPSLALFHLITHALFKALIFICAGTIIHYHSHAQDIRLLGNLTSQLPIPISAMIIANLALRGFPFLSGYYSKDAIIEAAIFNSTNPVALRLIIIATGLTALYSLRLSAYVLFRPSTQPALNIHSKDTNTNLPTLLLGTAAIRAGACLS